MSLGNGLIGDAIVFLTLRNVFREIKGGIINIFVSPLQCVELNTSLHFQTTNLPTIFKKKKNLPLSYLIFFAASQWHPFSITHTFSTIIVPSQKKKKSEFPLAPAPQTFHYTNYRLGKS